MRIDPRVCELKYEEERHILTEQVNVLEQRGIFVLNSSAFPDIEVFFAPRHLLRIGFPIGPPSGSGVQQFSAFEVPSLAARGFKVRFNLSDYDLFPPSLEFLDPWTNIPMDYQTMFRAFEFEKSRGAHLVLLGDHPVTHKPFLCLRGVREYHEHPQHSGDEWQLYRGNINLFSLIMSVWRTAVDIVRPQVVLQQTSVKPLGASVAQLQMQMQVIWAADEKL